MTVKPSSSLSSTGQALLIAAGTGVIAASYGLVRLAYGLLLPDVQAELGLDTDAAGLISSGASMIYCFAAAVGLVLASRRSRTLMLGAAGTAGLGAIGMALAPSTAAFAVFAILSSIGSGLASPAIVNILQRNVAPGNAGSAQMIANAGAGPGLIAAAILALMLLPNWRLAWGIAGVFMLVISALVLVLDRNPADGEGSMRIALTARWLRAHVLIIAGSLLIGAGSGVVWTYGRNLLVDAGAGEQLSVFTWIALGAGGTVVILTARWTDRFRPRTLWTIGAVTTALSVVMLALFPTVPVLAIAAFALFGWAYLLCCGVMIVWTVAIDPARAPAGTALLFILLVFGQALGAGLAGFIAVSSGYFAAFLLAAMLCLASALVVYARGAGSRRRGD